MAGRRLPAPAVAVAVAAAVVAARGQRPASWEIAGAQSPPGSPALRAAARARSGAPGIPAANGAAGLPAQHGVHELADPLLGFGSHEARVWAPDPRQQA